MNRTFKVAKSLTRGVVVTSEKASSYQGKAVKTVVAAAVAALMAGAAVAADETAAADQTYAGTVGSIVVDEGKTAEVTNTTVVTGKTDVKGTLSGNQDVTFEGAAANAGKIDLGSLTVNGGLDNTGFLKVDTAVLNSTLKTVLNFDTTNHFKFETLTVNEGGALEITKLGEKGIAAVTNGATANDKGNYTNLALTFTDGTINLNGGSLAIGTNGVLTVGEGDAAKTYGFVNDKGHLNLAVKTQNNNDAIINITKGDYVYGDLTLDGSNGKAEANLDGGNLTVDNLTVKGSSAKVNLTKGNAAVTDTLELQAGTFTLDGASLTIGKKLTVAEDSTFDFKKGVLTNNGAAAFSSTSGISLGDGATFDNNGTLKATSLTLNKGAKVSTDINTKDEEGKAVANYDVRTTTLNDGSTFELKSLNSNQYLGFGNKEETGKTYENDQFLVSGVWNLNGGDLIYNGSAVEKLKIGKGGDNDKTTNVVTINADYSFGDISFGQNGNLKVTKDNTLTVSNLYLSNGDATFENAGKLVVDKVIIKLADGVTGIQNTVITNEGEIYTSYDNLFTGKDGKYTTASYFGTALKGDSGTTYETAYEGTYTKDQLTKAQGLVGNIVFTKGSMVAADGKNVTASDVDGVITPNTVADSDAAKVEFKDNTEFGVLNFTGDGAKGDVTVTGTAQKTVTISGAKDGGALFTGVAADKTITVSTGNFVFGDEEKTTSIDRDLKVGADTSVALEGALNTKGISLETGATLDVNGVTTADYITGGSATVNGALAVSNMYVAPKETAPEIFTVQSNYTVQGDDEQTAVLAFGSDIAKAQAAAADAVARLDGVNSVLYIDKQLNVGSNTISIGGTTRAGGTPVSVGQTGAAVIDLAAYGASSPDKVKGVFADAASGSISKLVLTNLSNTALAKNDAGVYELNLGKVTADDVNFGTSDDFYKPSDGSSIAFDVNEVTLAEYSAFNSVGAMKTSLQNVQFGQNALADKLIFGMEDIYDAYEKSLYQQALAAGLIDAETTEDVFKDNYDTFNENGTGPGFVTEGKLAEYLAFVNQADSAFMSQLVGAEHAATNMAALGGAFTTALDINDQVTAAVSRRTSAQRVEGFTPWVDVFGTTNEAKRLYGNGAGYEADIYGAVLGFDYTAACGGTLGVAFNVGQADGNSVGSGAKVDNDADFYGFSLYGAQTFGDFNVKADLGYTQVSNDLSTNNILGSYKESLDANVFTFGLGTEYLAKFGALNVTPHAGIRLSRIDMDDSKFGADYDTMTVYQLPLGVAFSGNFDVNGWKLAPMVDLSVVPAFSDKDAVATYTGGIQSVPRVVDTNPIQATLGVSAQNGAWTFGLNYGLTAGGDDRMNNAFNANLRYSF